MQPRTFCGTLYSFGHIFSILSQKKQEFEFQETNSQKLGCIVFSLAAVSLEVSGEPCNSSIWPGHKLHGSFIVSGRRGRSLRDNRRKGKNDDCVISGGWRGAGSSLPGRTFTSECVIEIINFCSIWLNGLKCGLQCWVTCSDKQGKMCGANAIKVHLSHTLGFTIQLNNVGYNVFTSMTGKHNLLCQKPTTTSNTATSSCPNIS